MELILGFSFASFCKFLSIPAIATFIVCFFIFFIKNFVWYRNNLFCLLSYVFLSLILYIGIIYFMNNVFNYGLGHNLISKFLKSI